MKKWKREKVYGQPVEQVFEPQVEGRPWKVTLKCSTFEEADAKRKLLQEKWAETKLVGAEAKVKKTRGQYTVRVRVPDVPTKPEKKVEVTQAKEKKPDRRQQRNEKRGQKQRAEKENAWKKLKEQNESNPA